jgi:hypothetical protein
MPSMDRRRHRTRHRTRPERSPRVSGAFDQPDSPAAAIPVAVASEADAAQDLENLRTAITRLRPQIYVRLHRGDRIPVLTIADAAATDLAETIFRRNGQADSDVGALCVVLGPDHRPVTAPAAAAETVLEVLATRARSDVNGQSAPIGGVVHGRRHF